MVQWCNAHGCRALANKGKQLLEVVIGVFETILDQVLKIAYRSCIPFTDAATSVHVQTFGHVTIF